MFTIIAEYSLAQIHQWLNITDIQTFVTALKDTDELHLEGLNPDLYVSHFGMQPTVLAWICCCNSGGQSEMSQSKSCSCI